MQEQDWVWKWLGRTKSWGSTWSELYLNCAWAGWAQHEASSCPHYQHHDLVKSAVSPLVLWAYRFSFPCGMVVFVLHWLLYVPRREAATPSGTSWGWSTGQVKPQCALRQRFPFGSSQAGAVILLKSWVMCWMANPVCGLASAEMTAQHCGTGNVCSTFWEE